MRSLANNSMKKQIQETILTLVFSLVYILLVSRVSVLLLGLLPIPFILLGVRNNIKTNIFALVLFFSILNIMLNLSFAITSLALIMPVSLLAQYMIDKKYKGNDIIIALAIVFIVSIFGTLYVEKITTNVDIVSQMEEGFHDIVEIQEKNLKKMEMTELEIQQRVDIMETGISYLVTVTPMMLGFTCLLLGFLNYKIAAFLINKTYDPNMKVPKFANFKLPSNFIVGVGVMVVTSYVATKINLPYNGALKQNLIFLVTGLFLIQGFSLLDYFLDKIKVNKILKAIIMTLNVVMMPIGGILMALGFVDVFADFRKLRKKP